jgi:hypothetical protein
MFELTVVLEDIIQGAVHMARSVACRRIVAASCLLVFAIQPTSAQIQIGNVNGNAWDPLVGANPFFVFPGETQFRAVSVANNPFASPQFTGPVRLSVTCCFDYLTKTPAAANLYMLMVPYECRPIVALTENTVVAVEPPRTPVMADRPLRVPLPRCPADTTVTVNVGPSTPAQAYVLATAASAATPGLYIAKVHADYGLGPSMMKTEMEMFFSVVPATLPPDATSSVCLPPTLVLPLSSIKPPPFAWKRANPASTTYAFGAAFTTGPGNVGGGLTLTFSNASVTGPIPVDRTVVYFTNTRGWPVALRTVDSRNCAAAGQQIVVKQGETKSVSFSSSSTTTLVFSKSTCRAWVNEFDCWGQSALGLDDLVTLGEGSFWTLFGGRRVDIETVGDWGKIPRPNSVAVIRTP